MKKALALFLILALGSTMILTGCGREPLASRKAPLRLPELGGEGAPPPASLVYAASVVTL